MDNPKAIVRKTKRHGRGVFAARRIRAGEHIASFDGPIYGYHFENWTADLYSHAIQFKRYAWRDSLGIARVLNHSCEPNCGIRGLFDIVAMRTILPGEELTWDYEMTEDYKWRMRCTCATPSCRGRIGAYRNMPEAVRGKYRGFISEWLTAKPPRRGKPGRSGSVDRHPRRAGATLNTKPRR